MKERWGLAAAAVLLALVAFAAGVLLSRERTNASGQPALPADAVERLLTTPLSDPGGKPQRLEQWRGQPMFVNFWATWCPPCLQEIPHFDRLQKENPDIRFVGIATDRMDSVRDYLSGQPLSYPTLVATDGGTALMAALGNVRNALPYTLTLDAAGKVRNARLGGISAAEAEALVADLKRP